MKKILLFIALSALVMPVFPQEEKAEEEMSLDTVQVNEPAGQPADKIESGNIVEIKIGEGGFVKVIDKQDTMIIKVGKRGVKIVEGEEGRKVDIIDLNEQEEEMEQEEEQPERKHRKDRYNGHWEGLELGMNNFLNNSFEIGPKPEDDFMDLQMSKSYNVNLNLTEFNFGLIGKSVGITTGIGFGFFDYRFDNPITLVKDSANVIVPFDYSTEFDPPIYPVKSKLTSTYLSAPLLLEFQIPTSNRKHPVYLSGGVVGSVKIGSHTKVVYNDRGSREKEKERGNFNLSPLRYGFTARIGYKNFGFYATYFPTPVFEKNKGPELHPFAIGISFTD